MLKFIPTVIAAVTAGLITLFIWKYVDPILPQTRNIEIIQSTQEKQVAQKPQRNIGIKSTSINSDQLYEENLEKLNVKQESSTTIVSKGWLSAMSVRLKNNMPDREEREGFLRTVHYEATRAGLDPQLVLSVIQVESNFEKYAVSSAGARGYMQIMPFWVKKIGNENHNLFHLRVNIRYGCMILRHYLNKENGNYFRALGRYNDSLDKAEYPQKVLNAWRNRWDYPVANKNIEKKQENG